MSQKSKSPIEPDEAESIEAAHPMKTGRHDLYSEAMRLVGARHAKGDLVDLVNWLLLRVSKAEADVVVCGRVLNEINEGCLVYEKALKKILDRSEDNLISSIAQDALTPMELHGSSSIPTDPDIES